MNVCSPTLTTCVARPRSCKSRVRDFATSLFPRADPNQGRQDTGLGIGVGSDQRDATCWRGSHRQRIWKLEFGEGSGETDLRPDRQGIVVLGTPLGNPVFIHAHLERRWRNSARCWHGFFVGDLQSAWLILPHCAAARANYLLRVWSHSLSRARAHDEGIWSCLCTLLNISPFQDEIIRSCGNLPLVMGGLGLRSAARVSVSAYWASWADCLSMISARHPEVARSLVQQLQGHPETPFLSAAASSARVLIGAMGFDPPSWQSLPDEFEPWMERGGGNTRHYQRQFRKEVLFERMTPRDRALVQSQSGPGGSLALTTAPTSVLTKIPSHLFRVCAASVSHFRCPSMRASGRPIDPLPPPRRMCQDRGVGAAGIRARECCRSCVQGGRRTRHYERHGP